MKTFKIEKVKTDIDELNNVFVHSYYPTRDECLITGYFTESIARLRNDFEVGIWKVKSLKN